VGAELTSLENDDGDIVEGRFRECGEGGTSGRRVLKGDDSKIRSC
jgi:hypothetical protein